MTSTSAHGLHGHALEANTARAVAAEFVGTFVLVLAITATAVQAALAFPIAGGPYGSEAVALAGGFALIGIVAAFGAMSGAHVNPAVTLALAVTGMFRWALVPLYLVAQVAGAVLASLVLRYTDGPTASSVGNLGVTAPAPHISAGQVFVVELVVTFLLVLVVTQVATDPAVPRSGAALAIGLTLAVGILIAGPVSGAGINPARSLGPMIVTGRFPDWWVYVLAPVAGAVLAAGLHRLLKSRT